MHLFTVKKIFHVNVTLVIVARRFRTLRKSYLLNIRLSPRQTKTFTRHGNGMTLSHINFGWSDARNEPSKHIGRSCEGEITKAILCHTDRYQVILQCPSNTYDTFETADRIQKG